ncbi:recombinase family protein [Hominicoprocola fusiformis]
MGNRKQPFGYRMTLGEITIQPEEAELVRFIFQGYGAGATLGELTKVLCRQEIPYYAGRAWNKNMVSRILEDERYIGEKGYPALIEPEQLRTAAEKALRRLCGTPPPARVEKIVTDLLNELIRCPDRIQPAVSQVVGTACGKTREELTSALERQPIDEDNARALLLQLAAEQYDAIGNTEYETVRLRRLLTGCKPMTEPDAELLQSTVSKVRVTNKSVTVTLKNGQTIERRDQM